MKNPLCAKAWLLCGLLPGLLAAASPLRIVEGPATLPHVTSEQRTVDYWISRLPEPDRVLGDRQQLADQERQWMSQGNLLDIWSLPDAISRGRLREWLTGDFSYLERVGRYAPDGRSLGKKDYADIKKNVNQGALAGSNPCGWGLTLRRTALRLFPTNQIITAKPRNVEFNVLLHSGLRLAEPLALHHLSQDSQWIFVSSQVGCGWVAAQDVGRVANRQELWSHIQVSSYIVLTPEARFQDQAGQPLPDSGRMGCRLAASDVGTDWLAYPRRRADGSLFFIPVSPMTPESVRPAQRACTPRNILGQAFLLLDQEYGWGGGSGYGDCSEFTRRVGLSCGLNLPRSTSALRRALRGRALPRKPAAKTQDLQRLWGGETLLFMPGHVMLVLGKESGRTYVIHNLYGIHGQDAEGDLIRRVARVVVSDLSLGQGSRKGSLRQRVDRVLILGPGLDK